MSSGAGAPIKMAPKAGSGEVSAAIFPAAGVVLGAGSMFFTVLSHMAKGLQPPVPTISMTAFSPGTVAQFVFTGCLVVSAVFLFFTALLVRKAFDQKGFLAGVSFYAGLLSATGMAVTGVVPLQPDIMEILALPRHLRRMNMQSMVHSYAANVFFLAALLHVVVTTALLYFRRQGMWGATPADVKLLNSTISPRSMQLKVISCALSIMFIMSPLLLFMYPKIIGGSRVTMVALNQYGAVASLLTFFGTLTLDLLGTAILISPRSGKLKGE